MSTDASYNGRVYVKQGATELVIDNGGTLTIAVGAAINGLQNAIANLASGTIDLGPHLWNAREIASAENFATGSSAPSAWWGGLLNSETTPAFTINSTADQSFYLNWASANVDTIKLPPIAMPADFSTAGGLRVELYGRSAGTGTASDAAAAFSVNAWSGIGNSNIGTTHADFSSGYTWKTVSLASGSLTTSVLNITLTPKAHAGRALRLAAARIRYNRTT